MDFKMNLHTILMESDDFYRSLEESEKAKYLEEISNTLIGKRTKLEYYINKYIRRI